MLEACMWTLTFEHQSFSYLTSADITTLLRSILGTLLEIFCLLWYVEMGFFLCHNLGSSWRRGWETLAGVPIKQISHASKPYGLCLRWRYGWLPLRNRMICTATALCLYARIYLTLAVVSTHLILALYVISLNLTWKTRYSPEAKVSSAHCDLRESL